VWTTDTEMRFTCSVGRGLARLEVAPDEVVGRTVAEFLGPAGAQAVAAHARALQGERVAYTVAGRGSWQAFVEPMRDDEGAVTGVIGIALDHTDLATARHQAADSRRRLQGVFDGALEGFLLVDDDGRYVDVNPAFCELTGYPRDVLLEQRLGFISPDPEPIRSLFDEMRREGSVTTTYVIATADGSCRDIDLRGVANIAPGLHLFTLRDVTERRHVEIALRESEARLRFLMDQVPGIVWFVDRDLRVLSHTGQGHRVIGVEPDSLVGWHAPDYMGIDSPGVEAARRAVEGVSTLYEEHVLGRWWETHASPLRDDDGAIIGAVGVGIDVTETKQARAELEENRQRLQALFDNTIDAIFLADDAGRYLEVNPAAAALLGYPRETLIGMQVSDVAAPIEDASTAWEEFRGEGRSVGEFALKRADGTVIVTEFRAVADIVPGVNLSVVRDVTKRKRAEARLRDSEARFRRLAENAQDVIFRVRLDEPPRFEYLSPAVEEMVGRSPQEFYDDPGLALRLIHPDDRRTYRLDLSEARPRNVSTVRWQRRDGTYLWAEERHTFVHDADGNVVASEGIVRDVTDRVRIEEALREALTREQEASEHLRRLDTAKTAFLTAVSHELRTPLTSILGFAAVLESRGESLGCDGRRDMAQRILGNSRRLEGLLTDLLDLDGMSHGTRTLRRTPTGIGVLVRRVVDDIRTDEHPIRLEGEEFQAHLDVAQVERIVEHLVHNATRHTSPQTPIWVRWSKKDVGVLIQVDDAGAGVPPELRERIFERFQHGDTDAAKVGGTGIGLSLVRDFAGLHGGRAWVEERPGGGASFRVLLPYETLPSAAVAMVA
jgi:PAS domain S-box-containing protein